MVAANLLPTGSGGGGSTWTEMKTFGFQVLSGRWFMAFASLLIMSFAGAPFLLRLYSNEIKSSLGYDQTTLSLISLFRDSAGNIGVGLISGIINEFSPPWVVLSIGAVTNFFGYFMIWLAVTGRIAKPHVWHMCAYVAIATNSQTFVVTGAIVTCAKNFPASKGLVLGLLLGYVGLSGAIISQLYHAFFGDDAKSLILLMALLLTIVSIVFLPTIRHMELIPRPNEVKICYNMLYISLSLAGFLMVTIISQNRINFTRVYYTANSFVLLVLLFLPLAVVIKEELNLRKIKKQFLNEPSQVKVAKLQPAAISLTRPPDRGEGYTTMQAIFSIDMLLLYTAIACGIGGTLGAIDNLGQISDSLKYTSTSTSTFVSLVSIWNYLGGVVAGFGSDYVLKNFKFPRSLVLALFLLLSCFGHLLIAFAVPNSFYFASVIMGFCLGGQWPLTFGIISDIFDLKYYSTLVNIGTIAIPIGSYLVNVRVIEFLYDKEALKQMAALGHVRQPGRDLTCTGEECYRLSFIIVTLVTLLGFVASLLLVLRTRKLYRGDMFLKEEAEVVKNEMAPAGNEVAKANGKC